MSTEPTRERVAPAESIEADRIYTRYRNGLVPRREALNRLMDLLGLTRGEVNDLLDDTEHFPSSTRASTLPAPAERDSAWHDMRTPQEREDG